MMDVPTRTTTLGLRPAATLDGRPLTATDAAERRRQIIAGA